MCIRDRHREYNQPEHPIGDLGSEQQYLSSKDSSCQNSSVNNSAPSSSHLVVNDVIEQNYLLANSNPTQSSFVGDNFFQHSLFEDSESKCEHHLSALERNSSLIGYADEIIAPDSPIVGLVNISAIQLTNIA